MAFIDATIEFHNKLQIKYYLKYFSLQNYLWFWL